jgi:hypothetical protein
MRHTACSRPAVSPCSRRPRPVAERLDLHIRYDTLLFQDAHHADDRASQLNSEAFQDALIPLMHLDATFLDVIYVSNR